MYCCFQFQMKKIEKIYIMSELMRFDELLNIVIVPQVEERFEMELNKVFMILWEILKC